MAGRESACQENVDVVSPQKFFQVNSRMSLQSCKLTCQCITRLDSCLQKHLVQSLLIWYGYILFLSSLLFGAYDLMFMFAITSNEN